MGLPPTVPAEAVWRCPACGDPLRRPPAPVDFRRTPEERVAAALALRAALSCRCGLAQRVLARD